MRRRSAGRERCCEASRDRARRPRETGSGSSGVSESRHVSSIYVSASNGELDSREEGARTAKAPGEALGGARRLWRVPRPPFRNLRGPEPDPGGVVHPSSPFGGRGDTRRGGEESGRARLPPSGPHPRRARRRGGGEVLPPAREAPLRSGAAGMALSPSGARPPCRGTAGATAGRGADRGRAAEAAATARCPPRPRRGHRGVAVALDSGVRSSGRGAVTVWPTSLEEAGGQEDGAPGGTGLHDGVSPRRAEPQPESEAVSVRGWPLVEPDPVCWTPLPSTLS